MYTLTNHALPRVKTVEMKVDHHDQELHFIARSTGDTNWVIDNIKATARAKYPHLRNATFRIVDIY